MAHHLFEAQSIYELFAMQVRKAPNAIAITAPGRSSLTFSGLLNQIEDTVRALRSSGVNRNDRVGIVLPNGPEMAVAFVAVAAGATCAPLNPSYRENEFEFYLSDLNARAVIIDSSSHSPARAVARKLGMMVIELKASTQAEAGIFELIREHTAVCHGGNDYSLQDEVALVLHTSGTTSRPKIVPLTHTNICTSAHNISLTLKLSANDRCLNVMPLFHIHGLIGAVLSSLASGGSVVCPPAFDATKFFQWMDSSHPTWYTAVPTMHQAILAQVNSNRDILARHPLRFIRSSSAALPAKVMEALEGAFHAPVIESYGMTEAAHQMASNPLPPLPRKVGSVGIAGGPEIAVMNEVGELLPPETIGEVVIRGASVTGGYENNPAANGSAFTDGWFRTGDQGRLDGEGYLFLTGRLKEIINRGGEKVAPKEVDEVLARHPAVAQAVAFAVPHVTLGEDVAAAVVLRAGEQVTEGELLRLASDQLVTFKVPSQILIVDEIPKGPTGKLQRIGLAEKLADKLALKKRANYAAPKTQVERQLAEIWMRVLKVGEVGIRDSFYTCGGDSLSTVVMIAEVEKHFNAKIKLQRFLTSPTIETLAKYIQEAATANAHEFGVGTRSDGTRLISDRWASGIKNRMLQLAALYAPGFKTVRVWLHRMRGVVIGDNVSIGLSVLIETAYPKLVCIGNNVTIGMRSVVIAHLRDLTSGARETSGHTVTIEDNVYIGPGVIILPNVTIGHGAVVSAGSVVSRSVPPMTLVRGNPAEPIAQCGVSLGGGVPYEQFIRHLTPFNSKRPS
jgi:acyl-CoA synthetase (AMP-forming)/AMP-acid ligase II/acetyltransferase-like isoleucine patch superfamily enzyme/acyl carrier protein